MSGSTLELQHYLDEQGRVCTWPSKRHRNKQRAVLRYLVLQFEPHRRYREAEVNALLNQHHTFHDPALLRREMFDHQLMDRERNGSAYWRMDESEI
ncbi:DUF2087 domain-containing protein [Leptolyngbya sp. AN02str]|uniref:DUF2087 domain-containing protein n=1 Tax=Leptolyngbya sp. AN02str TaxID=3423363 RepID=UPI003D31F44C